jgi:hypothetical protein
MLYPRGGAYPDSDRFFSRQSTYRPGCPDLVPVSTDKRSLSAGQPGGGVAWFAHIGGFLAGMLRSLQTAFGRFFNPPTTIPAGSKLVSGLTATAGSHRCAAELSDVR